MRSYDHLDVNLMGDVVVLRLDRPEKFNALSLEMLAELAVAIDDVAATQSRALMIIGNGRAFCSGADLGQAVDHTGAPRDLGVILNDYYAPVIERLFRLSVPVVTAVNGPAAGGGCSLALAGDIVIAAKSSYFVQSFANIGLVPDSGSSWMLPRSIGRARAMEMMLLGEPVPAELALAWGLINRVVEDHSLEEEALALTAKLATRPTRSLSLIRDLARRSLETGLADALAAESEAQRLAGYTKDFKVAIDAFKSHEVPHFQGE